MDDDFIKLTQSAQFYKPRDVSVFNDVTIKEILDVASNNKIENTDYIIDEFRVNKIVKNIPFIYSAKIFLTEKPVYFLEDSKYKDQIYAFILLIEINNFLVLLKKAVLLQRIHSDLSPKNKTMTLMRFPLKWHHWRPQDEKTIYRRTNYKSHQIP